jgi:hypothetical protein
MSLVKMAPDERGENGWAKYEDIVPLFLDLLVEGPLLNAIYDDVPLKSRVFRVVK